MKLIPRDKIQKLEKAGDILKIKFNYPPFDGNKNEGSFDINPFLKTPEFQKFLGIIEDIGVHYEYAYKKGDKLKRIFMAITMTE